MIVLQLQWLTLQVAGSPPEASCALLNQPDAERLRFGSSAQRPTWRMRAEASRAALKLAHGFKGFPLGSVWRCARSANVQG